MVSWKYSPEDGAMRELAVEENDLYFGIRSKWSAEKGGSLNGYQSHSMGTMETIFLNSGSPVRTDA